MPCTSEYSYDETKERLKSIEEKIDRNRVLQEELDTVTEFLCEILRNNPNLVKGNEKLKSWWQKHQDWDKKNNR